MNKKNFTVATIRQIYERDVNEQGQPTCRACDSDQHGEFETIPHHIFFKSQLFRPCVSMAENGAVIHRRCHYLIHHSGLPDGKLFDQKLKWQALRMFKGKIPEADYLELEKIYRSRFGKI